jgi:hypothetical protein
MVVTLATLKAYLKSAAAQWSDPELTAAIATETIAQAQKVQVAAAIAAGDTAAIDEALHRRVQANLARRALPLGVISASGDGTPATYLPGTDPEIRRLEGPWRRRKMG